MYIVFVICVGWVLFRNTSDRAHVIKAEFVSADALSDYC